jgi:hypothetical protein
MPMWNVQSGNGNDETVEAGLLATEAGTLVALSEEGLLLRAWAPGQWRTVRHLAGGLPLDLTESEDAILIGLPQA